MAGVNGKTSLKMGLGMKILGGSLGAGHYLREENPILKEGRKKCYSLKPQQLRKVGAAARRSHWIRRTVYGAWAKDSGRDEGCMLPGTRPDTRTPL